MIQSNTIRLVPIHGVSLPKRGEASQLIFDAIPEFYEIFGNKRNVLLAISELLGETNSDISSGVMALDNDCVVGICTWVSNENLSSAQMYHLHYLRTKLARRNEEFLSKLKSYSEKIEPTHNLKSLYLSRITVSRDYMGTGLSSRMVDEFMKHVDAGQFGSLHVKVNNRRAIKFYNKMGFDFISSSPPPSRQLKNQNYNYRLMVTKSW